MWMQALSNASERQQHISEAEAGASKNRSHREQSKAAAVPSSSKSHNRGPTNMYGVPPPASIPGAPPGLPPPPKEARRSEIARATGGTGAIRYEANAQRLYAWGSNKKGQLALKPSAGIDVATASLIETLRNRNTPVAVSVGHSHMAAVYVI